MEIADLDRHFRRMELAASDSEFTQLEQELTNYLTGGNTEENEKHYAVFKAAVARQEQRSEIELATFRELMGKPVAV